MSNLISKLEAIQVNIDITTEQEVQEIQNAEPLVSNNTEEKSENINNNMVVKNEAQNVITNEILEIEKDIWQIEIPKIELKAPISNGTTKDVLNNYVGHFEETEEINRKCRTSCTQQRI